MYYLGKTRFNGLILRAVIAVLCLLGGIIMLGTDNTVAIVMFSVSLLSFINLIFCVVNRRLSKLRENLEQQKNLPEDVQKSLNRMSNPEYLEILINHNIDVPEWFFERIGATVVKSEETPVKEQKKYICDNCGATMTGWYQVCPNCGFSGKVRMGNDSEIALWNNKKLARVIISKEYAKDGRIPLEYVPAPVEEYMKPVNTVAKNQTTEEPAVEKELGICYCRFCGAKITEEDRFCHSCGAELNLEKASKWKHQKAETGRSIGSRPFIAIGAIALLILVALIVIIIILVKADRSVPMSAQSENSIQTPVPTVISTPEPTPDEPENTIILFPSPEQNDVDWPEEIDWTVEWGTVEDWMPYYSTRLAIKQAIQDSGIGNEEADTYAAAYMAARANGENDLEAHITALTTTDVDKYFLGKKEYTEYIHNSALAVGVNEYDIKKLSDGIEFTWECAWSTYIASREGRSKNHDQAIGSLNWSFFSNENYVEWAEGVRKEKYLECGLSKTEVSEKLEEEREELFRLLKECYEGPGLNIDR